MTRSIYRSCDKCPHTPQSSYQYLETNKIFECYTIFYGNEFTNSYCEMCKQRSGALATFTSDSAIIRCYFLNVCYKTPIIIITFPATMYCPCLEIKNRPISSYFYTIHNSTSTPFILKQQKKNVLPIVSKTLHSLPARFFVEANFQ